MHQTYSLNSWRKSLRIVIQNAEPEVTHPVASEESKTTTENLQPEVTESEVEVSKTGSENSQPEESETTAAAAATEELK